MATLKEIKELALHAARGTAPSTFSVDNVNEALRDELKQMAGSVNQFMKNLKVILEILVKLLREKIYQKMLYYI